MWDSLTQYGRTLVGETGLSATPAQMAARAAIMYLGTLFIVRIGKKRFMGQNTAFDVVLLFILGSVLSRAVNGSARMMPTFVAGLVLIGLHWIASYLTFRSHWLGDIIKGHTAVLVVDGQMQHENARHSHISRNDLMEGLRQQGIDDLAKVKKACLERNGGISVIARER